MAWTNSASIPEIKSGPYLLGKGAAGSEIDVGDIRPVSSRIFYSINEIKGGASFGPDTTVDVVYTGLGAYVSFGLMQNIGDDAKATASYAFPGSTLSTGPTKKTMTLDANTITGLSAVGASHTDRWVLHQKAVSDESDTSYDIVFPRAVVVPTDEEFAMLGNEDAVIIPCMLIALPDGNNDLVIVGKDAA